LRGEIQVVSSPTQVEVMMSDSNQRPATWLLMVFFVSGLGLLVMPGYHRVPVITGSADAVLGGFLLVTVVAAVAGPQITYLALRVVQKLFGR
jgi:hypothetical protein